MRVHLAMMHVCHLVINHNYHTMCYDKYSLECHSNVNMQILDVKMLQWLSYLRRVILCVLKLLRISCYTILNHKEVIVRIMLTYVKVNISRVISEIL